MFVRTSGPSVANSSRAQTSQPRCQSWSAVCRSPLGAISTQADGMTTALTRSGEYVCISGVAAIEYAAQVAQIGEAERIPFAAAGHVAARADGDERDADPRRSPRRPQKRRVRRSRRGRRRGAR